MCYEENIRKICLKLKRIFLAISSFGKQYIVEFPPSCETENKGMKLFLHRNTREGFFGSTNFSLSANLELTTSQKEIVRRNKILNRLF